MKLITFGDDPSKIKYLKSEYINIGLGKKYIDLFSKFVAFKEYIETVDPQEILIFVDGYDVVQRRTDLINFELKFKNSGADLIFSAETYCWPNPWIAYQFPKVPHSKTGPLPYRFPNSGTFVGYAWAIKKMLHWDRYRLNHDDQGYVHDFYLKNTEVKVGLDVDQTLFQTGTGIRWSVLDVCQAWFVHFNGKSHHKNDGSSVLDEYASGVPIGGIPQWHTVP
jgi:hypothetical protein